MHRKVLLAFALLGACATAPPHENRSCRTAGIRHFVGEPATEAVGNAILRETHAAVIRWARPGVMLTMDFRADRVTVRIGPDHKIAAINCG